MAKTSKKDPKNFDFEAALAELESLVSGMEEGDLTLEESLAAFEKGIKLTRECQQALKAAEQKVQILVSENGNTEPLEFAADDEESD